MQLLSHSVVTWLVFFELFLDICLQPSACGMNKCYPISELSRIGGGRCNIWLEQNIWKIV